MTSERPWLSSYDAGVPATLEPYPEATLLDFLAQTQRERPRGTAILFKSARLSYRALGGLSDAFAAALAAQGVARGDRVALLLPNCPQFLIAELGAWKAGATVVPLNPLYNEDELAGPLLDTGSETIVTLTPFYERVKRVQPRTAVKRVIATNIKEHLPPLLRLLFTLLKEKREGHRARLRDGDRRLPDLLAAYAGMSPPEPARPGDVALILMSGGTTGTPKGVMAPHRGLVMTGLQIHAWVRGSLVEWDDVFMLPLPLFHAAAGLLGLGAWLTGRNPLLLVPNPRDLDDLLATIRRERPALFGGVPTLFSAILDHPAARGGRIDFSSIKLCMCGAAPLMAETQRRFQALTGGRIIETYSLTEALVALVANPVRGRVKEGSVGVPLSDVEVRIVDSDTGTRPLPSGEVGEILIRGPQIMPGYWRRPEESAAVLRDHADGGGPWLHTGDLGYQDEDGFLFVVDRLKDLMKPSGLQVWPREVEEALATHPSVAEAAVAGVPDARKGEAVKAWIVLRDGASATAEEIRAHCKGKLAPFKAPALVEFRKELPKSLVGKVLRRVLVAEHRQAVAESSGRR
jgi:long-chain acyl-CoA synthetase